MKCSLASLFLIFFLVSCGRQEKINSFANPISMADQQGAEHFTFTTGVDFEDIDVNEPVGKIPIPVLGGIFEEFGNTLAGLFVRINGAWGVNQDPPIMEVPEMDLEGIVHSIRLKEIHLEIIPESIKDPQNPLRRIYNWLTFKRAKLDFLKKINIYAATPDMYRQERRIHIASYHFKREKLGCKDKCLNFRLIKSRDGKRQNLFALLNNNKELYIIPEVEIKSVPRQRFSMKGKIKFDVEFNLPF